MTGLLLLLLKYTGTKGCCYDYNWLFQKTILLRVVDTNMESCCLNKKEKVSWVNLDETLQMLIRKVLTLSSQHWRHEPLTNVLISMQVINPSTGFHHT